MPGILPEIPRFYGILAYPLYTDGPGELPKRIKGDCQRRELRHVGSQGEVWEGQHHRASVKIQRNLEVPKRCRAWGRPAARDDGLQ